MKNLFLILLIILSVSSCSDNPKLSEVDTGVVSTEKDIEKAYTLDAGDAVRVTVFNEEELSGEFEVDGSGYISIPLVGEIKAVGKSVRELEKDLETKLNTGFLLAPRVSIEVLNFRPFFILGEVNSPGSYPYVNKLTVLNAVALAGGYTYRAKTSKIFLKRGDVETTVEEYDTVLPGDVIKIKERLF